MEVESDDDFERLSQGDISDAEDDDFADTLHETPQSTPPTLTPSNSRLIPSRTKRFHCSWNGCPKSFVRQSRLDEHRRSHTNTRPFTCTYDSCDKAYFRDSHLKIHIKSAHTHEKDYKCTWESCEKRFATGQRLRTHLKVHQGQQKYKCAGYGGCNEAFRKKETLKRHVITVHEKKKLFQCPDINAMTGAKCTKEFDTAQKLRNHQKTNHDEKRFSCTDCLTDNAAVLALASPIDGPVLKQAYFATMAQLQVHNAEFHPPSCPHCQVPVESQCHLTAHLELAHDIKPEGAIDDADKAESSCPHSNCGKSYSKKGNLNIHIRAVHEKSLKFVCGATHIALQQGKIPPGTAIAGCGKNFSSKQVLEDHVRTAHLGLASLQTRRKRKAVSHVGRKAKRARTEELFASSNSADGMHASDEVPGYVWPAIDYDESDDEHGVMDLSGSVALMGSRIYHHGTAYHYPSGEYPSSSNSLELSVGPYQPVAESVDDGFFGRLEDFDSVDPLDPRLFAVSAGHGSIPQQS